MTASPATPPTATAPSAGAPSGPNTVGSRAAARARAVAGHGRLPLVIALLAALVILGTLVRYASAEHNDFAAYRTAARTLASGGRLYADALIWRDVGYTILDPRPAPPRPRPRRTSTRPCSRS